MTDARYVVLLCGIGFIIGMLLNAAGPKIIVQDCQEHTRESGR